MVKFLVDVGVGKKVEIVKKIIGKFSNQVADNFCVYQDGRLRIKK